MDTLEKQWGPVIKQAARKKPEFKIILNHWSLTAEVDDFEQGVIGPALPDRSGNGRGDGYPDIQALIKDLAARIPLPRDKKAWYVFGGEPGRIGASWNGDSNGAELTSSEKALWKKGQFTAYLWDLSAWVQFGRLWTPPDKELIKVTKLPVS